MVVVVVVVAAVITMAYFSTAKGPFGHAVHSWFPRAFSQAHKEFGQHSSLQKQRSAP